MVRDWTGWLIGCCSNKANGISNPSLIYPGQQLLIPGGNGGNPSPSPTPAPAPTTSGNVGSWSPGPGQLQGADTSNWQSDATFESSIRLKHSRAVEQTGKQPVR